jgi:hypothetical protein
MGKQFPQGVEKVTANHGILNSGQQIAPSFSTPSTIPPQIPKIPIHKLNNLKTSGILDNVSEMTMPQLHSLFLNPQVRKQYEDHPKNQMIMRNAVSEAKSKIETSIDDFLKKVIVLMEENKSVLFSALDSQLDYFGEFSNNFNSKVDDFVKDSLTQLATAQKQF